MRPARRASADALAAGLAGALLSYERVLLEDPQRRLRSAGQHDEIIAALGKGDRAGAADLVRRHFTTALPDLTAELDARRGSSN